MLQALFFVTCFCLVQAYDPNNPYDHLTDVYLVRCGKNLGCYHLAKPMVIGCIKKSQNETMFVENRCKENGTIANCKDYADEAIAYECVKAVDYSVVKKYLDRVQEVMTTSEFENAQADPAMPDHYVCVTNAAFKMIDIQDCIDMLIQMKERYANPVKTDETYSDSIAKQPMQMPGPGPMYDTNYDYETYGPNKVMQLIRDKCNGDRKCMDREQDKLERCVKDLMDEAKGSHGFNMKNVEKLMLECLEESEDSIGDFRRENEGIMSDGKKIWASWFMCTGGLLLLKVVV